MWNVIIYVINSGRMALKSIVKPFNIQIYNNI